MSSTSIVVCGQKFDIGTRVVLWNEPSGLNGYDTSRVVTKTEDRKTGKTITTVIEGKRYNKRSLLDPNLSKLQEIISQFFLHHSGLYRSSSTYDVLHKERKLSVTFILDDDGTLYQTLDVKEKAWQAGLNNTISVGIEIDSRATASKYPDAYDDAHCKKYEVKPRNSRIDYVQKMWVEGFEYSEAQYRTLICLGVALKKLFPLMSCDGLMDFPRNADQSIIKSILKKPLAHCGLICHYNTSASKIDPISFDHYRLLRGIYTNNPNQKSTFINDNWEERQNLLYQLGYNPGTIDGIPGPNTTNAIKKFQTHNYLIPTGEWDKKTNYLIDVISKN